METVHTPRRKHYYVNYYRDFANAYNICWTDSEAEDKEAEEQGWTRITRKEAIGLCVDERERRKYDQAFSGYADMLVYPWDYSDERYPEIEIEDSYFVKKN